MIEWKIKYTTCFDEEVEDSFFFHLNKAEVFEWLSAPGETSMDKRLSYIRRKKNTKEMINSIKDLIYRSYGEPSEDGKRFVKTDEVKAKFMETEAYSELFEQLVTDASAAARFMNGILPKNLAKDLDKWLDENPDQIPAEISEYLLKKDTENA